MRHQEVFATCVCSSALRLIFGYSLHISFLHIFSLPSITLIITTHTAIMFFFENIKLGNVQKAVILELLMNYIRADFANSTLCKPYAVGGFGKLADRRNPDVTFGNTVKTGHNYYLAILHFSC